MNFNKATDQKDLNSLFGTVGHCGLFLWCLGVMMLSPSDKIFWTSVLCALVLVIVYPSSWKNILTKRRLGLLVILVIPPLFLSGEADQLFQEIRISTAGIKVSSQIFFRYIVVLYALEGLTSAIDISSIAGLFERIGLHGIGFSMGVALNLLPNLQKSITQSWHSLKMKGGLRKKRWRGLKYFTLTAITNVLINVEEIALAAESRAFNPGKIRPVPIKAGKLDWILLPFFILSIMLIILIR